MALIGLGRRIIMHVAISFAVADLFHHRRDRIAQVQRHSKIAVPAGILNSFLQSDVRRIVLGPRG